MLILHTTAQQEKYLCDNIFAFVPMEDVNLFVLCTDSLFHECSMSAAEFTVLG